MVALASTVDGPHSPQFQGGDSQGVGSLGHGSQAGVAQWSEHSLTSIPPDLRPFVTLAKRLVFVMAKRSSGPIGVGPRLIRFLDRFSERLEAAVKGLPSATSQTVMETVELAAQAGLREWADSPDGAFFNQDGRSDVECLLMERLGFMPADCTAPDSFDGNAA